ncbi:hypothetical protein MTO96_043104 [Rhipicephalus appendiculatus]
MARRAAVGKRSRYLRKTKAKWHSGTFESLTAPTEVRRRGRVFVGSTLLSLPATEEGHDSDTAPLTELPRRMKKTCVPPPVCRAHRATCSDSEWGGTLSVAADPDPPPCPKVSSRCSDHARARRA